MHDQIASNYSKYQKIVSLLVSNYYYAKIKDIVYCYISNCYIFKCAKTRRDQYNNLLKPLLILTCPRTNIILDFMTKLLPSSDKNTVLMVIDRLTKKRHYILCITDKNSVIAETTSYLLLNNV